MIAAVLAAVVLTGALVTGCTATAQPGPLPAATAPAGAPPSTRAPSHITTRQVPQARSDPGAGAGYPSLALVGPAGGGNGKLVVFLPGTGDAPSCCRQFLAEAVVLSFHAVSLGYDNATPVATRCSGDLSCYRTMHENVFTGTDASRVSSVRLRGGVEHRQIALLSYLRRRDPGESWGQFLAGDRADMARSCWPGTPSAAPRPRSSPRSAGSSGFLSPARRKEPIPRSLPFRPQATSAPERAATCTGWPAPLTA